MEWINIHVSTIDSESFRDAKSSERSTWLLLLRFCCGQENGGLIEDAKAWADRKWQRTVGVTLKDVHRPCGLWTWEQENLRVSFYPEAQERATQAQRSAARSTNSKRRANRDGERDGERVAKVREGRERKRKEREPSSSHHFVLPSQEEMKAAAAAYPGNAAIGAPAKIPVWWALDLLAWGKEHPDRWPGARWQTWLVERFEADWRDPLSRPHRKNTAAAEQHRLPDDEPDWWELPLDQLNARLTGIALRGDTKARDRVKEILKLRGLKP